MKKTLGCVMVERMEDNGLQPGKTGFGQRMAAIALDAGMFLLFSFGLYVLWAAFARLLWAPDAVGTISTGAWWLVADEAGLLCAVLVSAWLVLRRRGLPVSGLGLSFRRREALKGGGLAVAAYACVLVLSWGLGIVRLESVAFPAASLSIMALYFLLVALAEELMVRGFLLGRMLDGGLNCWAALLLSSLLFSLMHLFNPAFSWLSLLNILLAGLVLGVPYVYTRNLSFPVFFHWLWNWLQGPVLGYCVSGNETGESLFFFTLSGPDWLTGGSFGFEGSLLCSVLLLLILGGLLRCYGRRRMA